MSKPIHLQLTLHASPSDVFHALTDETALTTWFAENAAISLEEKRYDFWGRFTPETPTQEQGRHNLPEEWARANRDAHPYREPKRITTARDRRAAA